ncbi:hypothetical protein KI387_039133, partial [Taxus chinensis]
MGNILRRSLKREVMKVDGRKTKMQRCSYVKEVFCDYPNHEADSVPRLGNLSRPLPHSEEIDDKSTKYSKGALRIISASDNGSTVRLRIRLTKEELASL